MKLLPASVLVSIAAVAIGCHDTSGPPQLPATYLLSRINGNPVPTPVSPIPESPTILSGQLLLDDAGNAVLIEHRLVMINPGDVTDTASYTYTIRGNSIQLDRICPPAAVCVGPPVGTFVGSHLFLDLSAGHGTLVYDFELAPSGGFHLD